MLGKIKDLIKCNPKLEGYFNSTSTRKYAVGNLYGILNKRNIGIFNKKNVFSYYRDPY